MKLRDLRALGHRDSILEEEGSVVVAAFPAEGAAFGTVPCHPFEQQTCVATFQEVGLKPAVTYREAAGADLEVSSHEGEATSSAVHPWLGEVEVAPLLDGVEAPVEVASGDEVPPLGAAAAPGDGK